MFAHLLKTVCEMPKTTKLYCFKILKSVKGCPTKIVRMDFREKNLKKKKLMYTVILALF